MIIDISQDSNQDKFGYYQVGDFKTYSKIEAITRHHDKNIHPEWNFNESVFSSYNWKQEPSIDLKELYRQRAQQIRDKYDYLVLFYSGGADSQNILDTFVNNDIHLDECASIITEYASSDQDSWPNKEVFTVAVPRMKLLPTIKHRLIDQSIITNDAFKDSEIYSNWFWFMNGFFSPNNFTRTFIRKVIADYKNMIDQGKSVCFIWGAEKPRLYQIDGKYCIRFLDINDDKVSPWAQTKPTPGEFDEYFYWSPDFVPGMIKQAHLIMRFLKTAPINNVDFTIDPKQRQHFASVVRDNKKYFLTQHGIHKIIYPTWDINTFSQGKSRSPMWSNKDDWFFDSQQWNVAAQNFRRGYDKMTSLLINNVDAYWMNNPNDIHRGVKGCISPPYFLE